MILSLHLPIFLKCCWGSVLRWDARVLSFMGYAS
jgi:hypothetical protein